MSDRIVGVFEAGQLYMVRTDHIGRPVFATNTSGVKVWEASYGPFGEVVTTSGPTIGLRFPGQWFQSESGLYQNWMRDYDPALGRYLQADPLGLVDGASVYGYARQNPGRWIDPRGEEAIPFPMPLPPIFTPGTEEATKSGELLLEWSRRYNPIDLAILNRPQFAGGSKVSMDGAYGKK